MDYYQEELRKRGASPVSPTPKRSSSSLPVKTLDELNGGQDDGGILSPTNPIGWTLDMLSRPLYGMQGGISKTLDITKEGSNAIRAGGDTFTETLKGVGRLLTPFGETAQ